MKILNFFTAKIRDYFTIWDIKLIQLSAMLILIVLIKIDGFVKSYFRLETVILSVVERYNKASSYEILRLRSE